MGSQFSDYFLLGYRAGHRDGFAAAVLRMRDAATAHAQVLSLSRREEQLALLLSGGGLVSGTESATSEGARTTQQALLAS